MTTAPLAEPRVRERRMAAGRRSIELLLDSSFRPGNWAAKVAYTLGLQGRLRVSTTTIRAHTPLPRPLRIAFASDFHAGPTTHQTILARACTALDHLEPDVLLLGGDFVSVRGEDIARLAPRLADIDAPFGKFAVLGNHDLKANSPQVIGGLERAGVRVLVNEHVTLPEPFAGVTIAGLDDPTRGHPRADLALDGATGTRVVLMHSPDGILSIGDRPFDVALCGHTHGGQISLPNGRAIVVPSGSLSRRYCRGQFPVGGGTLVVSRGVGCSAVPVRAFAPPEVHLCLIV